MRQRLTAMNNAEQALAAVIDPLNQNHAASVMSQAVGIIVSVLSAVAASNQGAVPQQPLGAVVDAALIRVLEADGLTVSLSGNTDYVTGSDPATVFADSIVHFLQSNDVTLG
jgi:hypothetical protein